VTDCDPDPPGPVHVSVNVPVAASAPVDSLPEVGFDPDHPPDAVHAFEFALLHVSVALAPCATAEALVDNETVGAGEGNCEGPPPPPPHPPRDATSAIAMPHRVIRSTRGWWIATDILSRQTLPWRIFETL